jgi:maltose/moltooligosaccharide transporter
VKRLYDSHAIYAIVIAGICLFIAAFSVLFVEDKDDTLRVKNEK